MSLIPNESTVSFAEILPGLVQGSRPPPGDWLRRIGCSAVAFCAVEYQPDRVYYPGLVILRAHLDDDGTPMTEAEWQAAKRVSQVVAELVRSGRKVYVSCHMGLNRSGLVSALTIHRLVGMSGRRASLLVQERRPGALSNAYFRAALDSIPRRDDQALARRPMRRQSPMPVGYPVAGRTRAPR